MTEIPFKTPFSRRPFLRATAAGLGAALLAACRISPPDNQPTRSPTPIPSSTPSRFLESGIPQPLKIEDYEAFTKEKMFNLPAWDDLSYLNDKKEQIKTEGWDQFQFDLGSDFDNLTPAEKTQRLNKRSLVYLTQLLDKMENSSVREFRTAAVTLKAALLQEGQTASGNNMIKLVFASFTDEATFAGLPPPKEEDKQSAMLVDFQFDEKLNLYYKLMVNSDYFYGSKKSQVPQFDAFWAYALAHEVAHIIFNTQLVQDYSNYTGYKTISPEYIIAIKKLHLESEMYAYWFSAGAAAGINSAYPNRRAELLSGIFSNTAMARLEAQIKNTDTQWYEDPWRAYISAIEAGNNFR